jgi:hypothetical protein
MQLAALPIQFEEAPLAALGRRAPSPSFSLRAARGEGGRRPDEGCGHLRRRGQPLTPALSPCSAKGEGEERASSPHHQVAAIQLASLFSASDLSSGSGLRSLSASPQPSPAGRGRNFAVVSALRRVTLRSQAAAGPLSQRERDGVREKTSTSPTAQHRTKAPLISTGPQPGVSPCGRGSRFNGFPVARLSHPGEAVETVSPAPAAHTRLKPGADESGVPSPRPGCGRGRLRSIALFPFRPFFLPASFCQP